MIKILALITVLAFVSNTQTWSGWNTFAANNQAYVQSLTSSLPSIPSGYSRYTDTTPNQANYANRWNQYRYNISNGYGTCNVYCGLRSFLTTDANGTYVCYRDQDSNFWGGASGYTSHCIPDVDKTNACSLALPDYGGVGRCNMASYTDPKFAAYECCYTTITIPPPDNLIVRFVRTTLYTLRNAE